MMCLLVLSGYLIKLERVKCYIWLKSFYFRDVRIVFINENIKELLIWFGISYI